MRLLVGILAAWGLLGWGAAGGENDGAGTVDPAGGGRRVTATAPAAEGAHPMPGPRNKRPLEGRAPRDVRPNVAGGTGPRKQGMRPGAGGDEPLTVQQVQQVMDFTREKLPQIHERLVLLRERNPQKFQQMLREVRKRLQPMLDAWKRDPKLAEMMIAEHRLQLQITELSERYRQSQSDSERTRLRADIQDRLREQFEMYQTRMKAEIERLRKRLDEQERQLVKREQRKEEMLRQKADRLLNRPPGKAGTDDREAGGG